MLISLRRSIDMFRFQPFGGRRGVDTVIGLKFAYDTEVIAVIKDALLQQRRPGFVPGGWLPEWKTWWIEEGAWPAVSEELVMLGCRLKWRPAPEGQP
ncbi:MAG: hypothetical protein ACR2PL_22215 [Dehalococcoidia bacterium]